MSNINKIIIAVVSCVFMICVASVSIVSIVTSNKEPTTTTAQNQQQGETLPPPSSAETTAPTGFSEDPTTTTASSNTTTSGSNTTTTTTTAVVSDPTSGTIDSDLSTQLLGKWVDSAGMSGWEFLADGKVNVTYVNLSQFGVPFDGQAPGLYTLEGDTLTIKFSIYTATIQKTFRASVSGNELSLYDLEERETSTYMRAS